MTILEIILIAIIWIAYGTFNAWQHDWHVDPYNWSYEFAMFYSGLNIVFAPIALLIRIFRGVFIWKGDY